MHTIRQTGGLSGFTKRDESEYDPFGAGHSSTSVSAALGMAVGRDFKVGPLVGRVIEPCISLARVASQSASWLPQDPVLGKSNPSSQIPAYLTSAVCQRWSSCCSSLLLLHAHPC